MSLLFTPLHVFLHSCPTCVSYTKYKIVQVNFSSFVLKIVSKHVGPELKDHTVKSFFQMRVIVTLKRSLHSNNSGPLDRYPNDDIRVIDGTQTESCLRVMLFRLLVYKSSI